MAKTEIILGKAGYISMEVKYQLSYTTSGTTGASFKPLTDNWCYIQETGTSGYFSSICIHDATMGSNMKVISHTTSGSSESTVAISSLFTVASDGTLTRTGGVSRAYTIIVITEGDGSVTFL